MFNHLFRGVRSLPKARRFYGALLKPLGHEAHVVTEAELAYATSGYDPDISGDYCGAVVLDPDVNKLKIVAEPAAK